MKMTTSSSVNESGYLAYSARFSDLPKGMPDVVVTIDTGDLPDVDNVTPVTKGITAITLDNPPALGVTADHLRRLADLLPQLTELTYSATSFSATPGMRLFASEAGRDVIEAADLYRKAVAEGRSPHDAIMAQQNVSKATASRRIRAAKDAGLLPEKASQL